MEMQQAVYTYSGNRVQGGAGLGIAALSQPSLREPFNSLGTTFAASKDRVGYYIGRTDSLGYVACAVRYAASEGDGRGVVYAHMVATGTERCSVGEWLHLYRFYEGGTPWGSNQLLPPLQINEDTVLPVMRPELSEGMWAGIFSGAYAALLNDCGFQMEVQDPGKFVYVVHRIYSVLPPSLGRRLSASLDGAREDAKLQFRLSQTGETRLLSGESAVAPVFLWLAEEGHEEEKRALLGELEADVFSVSPEPRIPHRDFPLLCQIMKHGYPPMPKSTQEREKMAAQLDPVSNGMGKRSQDTPFWRSMQGRIQIPLKGVSEFTSRFSQRRTAADSRMLAASLLESENPAAMLAESYCAMNRNGASSLLWWMLAYCPECFGNVCEKLSDREPSRGTDLLADLDTTLRQNGLPKGWEERLEEANPALWNPQRAPQDTLKLLEQRRSCFGSGHLYSEERLRELTRDAFQRAAHTQPVQVVLQLGAAIPLLQEEWMAPLWETYLTGQVIPQLERLPMEDGFGRCWESCASAVGRLSAVWERYVTAAVQYLLRTEDAKGVYDSALRYEALYQKERQPLWEEWLEKELERLGREGSFAPWNAGWRFYHALNGGTICWPRFPEALLVWLSGHSAFDRLSTEQKEALRRQVDSAVWQAQFKDLLRQAKTPEEFQFCVMGDSAAYTREQDAIQEWWVRYVQSRSWEELMALPIRNWQGLIRPVKCYNAVFAACVDRLLALLRQRPLTEIGQLCVFEERDAGEGKRGGEKRPGELEQMLQEVLGWIDRQGSPERRSAVQNKVRAFVAEWAGLGCQLLRKRCGAVNQSDIRRLREEISCYQYWIGQKEQGGILSAEECGSYREQGGKLLRQLEQQEQLRFDSVEQVNRYLAEFLTKTPRPYADEFSAVQFEKIFRALSSLLNGSPDLCPRETEFKRITQILEKETCAKNGAFTAVVKDAYGLLLERYLRTFQGQADAKVKRGLSFLLGEHRKQFTILSEGIFLEKVLNLADERVVEEVIAYNADQIEKGGDGARCLAASSAAWDAYTRRPEKEGVLLPKQDRERVVLQVLLLEEPPLEVDAARAVGEDCSVERLRRAMDSDPDGRPAAQTEEDFALVGWSVQKLLMKPMPDTYCSVESLQKLLRVALEYKEWDTGATVRALLDPLKGKLRRVKPGQLALLEQAWSRVVTDERLAQALPAYLEQAGVRERVSVPPVTHDQERPAVEQRPEPAPVQERSEESAPPAQAERASEPQTMQQPAASVAPEAQRPVRREHRDQGFLAQVKKGIAHMGGLVRFAFVVLIVLLVVSVAVISVQQSHVNDLRQQIEALETEVSEKDTQIERLERELANR